MYARQEGGGGGGNSVWQIGKVGIFVTFAQSITFKSSRTYAGVEPINLSRT